MAFFHRVVVALAAIALAGCDPQSVGASAGRSTAAPSKAGTWQLLPISDGGVWKINTETGETRRCIDGMVEKACVLAIDVDSVAQLREGAAPAATALAPTVAAPEDGLPAPATPSEPAPTSPQ